MFTEVNCFVLGKVQNVGYRDFVQNAAKQHNLNGWVNNLEDGRVEVVAQGLLDNLKLFVEELNEGSVLSEVETVSIEWKTASKHFYDFVVIYH